MVDYWDNYILNNQHKYTLSGGYSFDLSELTVVMPILRERWALHKSKRDLTPDLVPTFWFNDQLLSNLYNGRDYEVAFFLRRGSDGRKGGRPNAKHRLRTVVHAGKYRAIVTGASVHLKGEAVVDFQVKRRSFAPVFIVVAVLVALASGLFAVTLLHP